MLNFPFVNIPQRFSHILQTDMQASGGNFSNLRDIIYADQGLRAIVRMSFENLGKNLEITNALKSLGWYGFRNKIASMYLTFAEEGGYINEPREELLADVINFENSLKDYVVAGYSRAFLLGMYCQLSEMGKTPSGEQIKIDFGEDITTYLELIHGRSVYIDWLVLQLYHFHVFLGKQELMNEVRKGTSFNTLYDQLLAEQKKIMVGNLLTYGASIDDVDTLSMQRI